MCLGKVISDFQMQSLCISSTVGDSFGLNGEGPASVETESPDRPVHFLVMPLWASSVCDLRK